MRNVSAGEDPIKVYYSWLDTLFTHGWITSSPCLVVSSVWAIEKGIISILFVALFHCLYFNHNQICIYKN